MYSTLFYTERAKYFLQPNPDMDTEQEFYTMSYSQPI